MSIPFIVLTSVLFENDAPQINLMGVPFAIVWFWIWLAATIKRVHDLELPGYWCLMVMPASGLGLIMLLCTEGQAYDNRYGAPQI